MQRKTLVALIIEANMYFLAHTQLLIVTDVV